MLILNKAFLNYYTIECISYAFFYFLLLHIKLNYQNWMDYINFPCHHHHNCLWLNDIYLFFYVLVIVLNHDYDDAHVNVYGHDDHVHGYVHDDDDHDYVRAHDVLINDKDHKVSLNYLPY